MKNLLLTLVVFSVLLLIGCRENSITEPVPVTEQKTVEPSITTGVILLEGMLQDPHPVMNSYYIIQGEIRYQHILHFSAPVQPNPQFIVSLNLSGYAYLTYLCTVCLPPTEDTQAGTISIETNDDILMPVGGNHTFIKTFEILGRDDGMVLKCSFTVTTESIDLNVMWLELNDGVKSINHFN